MEGPVSREMLKLENDIQNEVYNAELAIMCRRESLSWIKRPSELLTRLEALNRLKEAVSLAEQLEIQIKNVRKSAMKLQENNHNNGKSREVLNSAKEVLGELRARKLDFELLPCDIDLSKFGLGLYYLLMFIYFPFSNFSISTSPPSLCLSFVGVFFFFNSLDFHFLFFNYLFFTSFPFSSRTFFAVAGFYLFYFFLYLVICAQLVSFTYLLSLLVPGKPLRFYCWGMGVITNLHRIRSLYTVIGCNFNFGGIQIIRQVRIAGNVAFGEPHLLAQRFQKRVVSLAGTIINNLRLVIKENVDADVDAEVFSCVALPLKVITSIEIFPYCHRIFHLLFYCIWFFYDPISSNCSSSSSRLLLFVVVYAFFDSKAFHILYFHFLLYTYFPGHIFCLIIISPLTTKICLLLYGVTYMCVYYGCSLFVVVLGMLCLKVYRWVVQSLIAWIYTWCFVGGNINFGGTQIIEEVSLGHTAHKYQENVEDDEEVKERDGSRKCR